MKNEPDRATEQAPVGVSIPACGGIVASISVAHLRRSMPVPPPRMRVPACSRAFTLIELLITIGAVAILGTILSTSLAIGSNRAKRSKCQGVLRQSHLTTILYVHDNGGIVPPLAVILKPSPSAPICPGAVTLHDEPGIGGGRAGSCGEKCA